MTTPTGHSNEGVWLNTVGDILGQGCSDSFDDEAGDIAEFVPYTADEGAADEDAHELVL